ncbi:MAG: ArnT family glycosyltransferase [Limisphaerales bacterium]
MTQPSDAPPPARSPLFHRHWTWWFMVLVLVLFAAIRLRLLNLPLERDEGEYAYAGQLMLQGIPPYQLAYNMKFPGTYAAYAAMLALFGQTPAGIHFGVLVLTTLTALMLFWLGRQMLDWTAGMVAATFYTVLAASPSMLGLAGHATHFAAFFATAGVCMMWKARPDGKWPIVALSGLPFGLAILMKQPAALIAFWAVMAFAAIRFRRTETSIGKRLGSVAAFGAGIILPFALCCLVLWRTGVFEKFWFWTIDYARQYASIVPITESPRFFRAGAGRVIAANYSLWLIAAGGLVLIWFDRRLQKNRVWLLGFSLASALSVCPGFYFRKHYFLLMLPAWALLAGCTVSGLRRLWNEKNRASQLGDWPVWGYGLMIAVTVLVNSDIWFVQDVKTQVSRTIYGADPFPEAQLVASYIRANSPPSAPIAVLGSEPEIYFLSRRHSVTGYIYTYGMMEPQPFARRMQEEMIHDIEISRPRFIIFVDDPMSWFRQPDSDMRILDWWKSYQTNYTLVAISDVISPTETINAWGADMVKRYGGARGSALEVYQRTATSPILRPDPGATEPF